MRTMLPITLACLLAPLSHAAIQLAHSDSPAVYGVSTQRRSGILPHNARRKVRRQDGTATVTLDNKQTLYFANVTIGTPSQELHLQLDTGSSDMWVNSAQSTICTAQGQYCSISGTYSANDSSSYNYVNDVFNISYADGSGASGDYVSDKVSFGDLTVLNLQFGVGYSSTSPQGVLGIGFQDGEVQVNRAGLDQYNNLPAALVAQGTIKTNSYSLWLNDLDASMGSILFGGVDKAKYTDPLSTVPIIPQYGQYLRFIIALTDIGTNGNTGSIGTKLNAPVLLDSGSSITYLPNDIVNTLYSNFKVNYNSNHGVGVVDCSVAGQDDTVDFTFSGATIRVPVNEMILQSKRRNGDTACIFGVSPSEGSTSILGDTFLRSAYVVYDLTAHEISLAQTDFNATDTNIMEIATGSTGIPGATLVPNPVTSVNGVETGIGRIQTVGKLNPAAMVTPAPQMTYGAAAVAGIGALWAL